MTTTPCRPRRPRTAATRLLIWTTAILMSSTLLYVAVRHVVPAGLGGLKFVPPYLFFSYDRGEFVSPGGTRRVRIVTNDGGAAHSGNFTTWVIVRHWWGQEVVAKGYLTSSTEPVPITWIDEYFLRIAFTPSRYTSEEVSVVVTLP